MSTLDLFHGLPDEAAAAMLHWFATRGVGASSQTIARAILGKEDSSEDYHPLDLSDFGRCQGLLKTHPAIYEQFVRVMPKKGPHWAHLVQVWSAVQYLLDNGCKNEAYALMNTAKENAAKEIKKGRSDDRATESTGL